MTAEFEPGQRIRHRGLGLGRFVADTIHRADVIIAPDSDPDDEVRVSRDWVEAVDE